MTRELLLLWLAAGGFLPPSPLEFLHRNSPTPQKYLPETMGGGVALLDYDGDGRLDIFLVNGGKIDASGDFRRAESANWNRLYRQTPAGAFVDVTADAGLHRAGNAYGMGAAVGDFDGDGDADLYVTNFGPNALYRNNGNGTFTDVTAAAGVAGGGWSVSAAFLDYDNDGRLDLFVARYLDWQVSRNILCGTPFNAYCRPDKFNGTANLLFHNEGGGKFRDVSEASGIAAAKGKGMGVAVNDANGDGLADIFVSNDGMEQYLFRNQGNGKFTEAAMDAGVALSDDAKTFAGMGAAFADFDNDGRPDIAVTNLALEKYALYRNEGDGQFRYASLTSGLAALTANNSGWGIGIHDFDNDGWKDLFVAQSHVLDNVEKIHAGLRYLEPPALLRNVEGRFVRAPLAAPAVAGRGVAFGDLDNDGSLDAVMAVLGGRPLVFRNKPAKPGATLHLIGRAEGARVKAGNQHVYATSSGSYLSASDLRVHLAGAAKNVEIVWPGGRRQVVPEVPAGRVTAVR